MATGHDAPTIDGMDGLVEIGRGGFALVYRAHQAAFRRDVAIKVLTRSGLDADDKRRFERECQAMGLLSDHPGIVTLYDAGFTDDGRPYMVMAHVGGGSLADHLATDGPMSWAEVSKLGVRLSGALETAHRAAVLHRDIKPANILRSDYGEQLSDFGIARIAGGHETRSGVITASLAHAAPEILDGSRPTIQADVYSLGSTLYEAAMGQAAFVRDTDESLLPLIRRVVTDPVPDMEVGGVPGPLARVIEVAMAKDPEDRYASSEAFGLALRGAQAVLGIPVTDLAIVGGINDATIITNRDRALGTITGELTGRRPDPTSTVHEPDDEPAAPPPQTRTSPADPPQAQAPVTEQPPRQAEPAPAATTTPPGSAAPSRGHREAAPPPPPYEPGPPPGVSGTRPPDGPAGRGSRGAVIFAGIGLVAALIAAVIFIATRGDDPNAGNGQSTTTASTTSTTADTTTSTTEPSTTLPPVTGDPQGPGAVILAGQNRGQVEALIDGIQQEFDQNGQPSPTVDIVGPEALRPRLAELAQDGYDPVIAIGPPARQAVAAISANWPDTTFVLIDGFIDAPNVVSIEFAVNESSFVGGVAAARATLTGRVAFIGGIDDPPTRASEAGYVAGVRYHDPGNPNDVRYLDDEFGNPEAARQLTNLVLAGGADVVYHVAGPAGSGVLDAAAVSGGVWTIGSDVDWFVTVAEDQQPFVLTSTMKNFGTAYRLVIDAAADGTLTPGPTRLGIAQGGVDFSISGGYLDAILDELLSVGQGVAEGSIFAPDVVIQRALAPQGALCPAEGCSIRILDAQPSGAELAVTLEANWAMSVNGIHAHYFWSPTYAANQVGGDSAARFGVAVGSWDLDDRFPFYVTENAASTSLRGNATELCVTAADANHNVVDPALVSCFPVG